MGLPDLSGLVSDSSARVRDRNRKIVNLDIPAVLGGNGASGSGKSFCSIERVSVQMILAFIFRFQDLSVRETPAVAQVSVDVTNFVITMCIFRTYEFKWRLVFGSAGIWQFGDNVAKCTTA
jgi:hypothetical protein